jgi:hypothetical protein
MIAPLIKGVFLPIDFLNGPAYNYLNYPKQEFAIKMYLPFFHAAMNAKLIVRKEDVAKRGLEEELFRLAKIIYSDTSTWIFVPADNLQEMMRMLEDQRISYGIESEQEFIRERLRG